MATTNRLKGRAIGMEALEARMCLASSVGWDGPGQGSASLTYYIGQVPANMGLSRAAVESAIETALDAWSDAANIKFTETSLANQPDSLDVSFKALDGPGGTLARAYYPDDINRNPIAGDLVFDTAETWEIGNDRGNVAFDFVRVAVHEIGHALGLSHNDTPGSIMAGSVSRSQKFTTLPTVDINAIQQLYAAPRPATSPSTPTTPSSSGGSQSTDANETASPSSSTTWQQWLSGANQYVWWRNFFTTRRS